MNRISGIRLVFVVTALTALLTVPMAHARGLESPRPGARAEAGWLGAAMGWLEAITGVRLAPRTRAAVNKEETGGTTSGGGLTGGGEYGTTGGTCIDPQGRPRPLCDV
jgi:hypothetical protein